MPFLPTPQTNARKFQPSRPTALFAAIIALFFVVAINDARAQESTTNTNEFLFDPFFGSFGLMSFGDGGGGLSLDEGSDGGTFTSTAATGTYTTNSSQAWAQNSGMRTAGTAGYTISQYSFGTDTSQGQVNGGYFSTGTTIGSGTAEALQVGQTFLFRMGGEDDSGRTGVQTGGRIGFSLGSGTDIFNGGSGIARATNDSLVRVEFIGGDLSASFTGDTKVTGSMPGFGDFKSGQFYAIEVLSSDEFILRYGTTGSANTVVYNMQDFAGSGGSIGKITFYNLGQNMASIFSNIVVSNSSYLNFSNNSAETNTISGVISDNGGTANAAVKNGVGTVIFSGNNTYTGATTISNGTLGVTVNNALGTTAAGTTVLTNTTLDFQNVTYSTTEAVTLNGGTIAASTGTSSFAGAITLGGASTFNINGTQLTLSGAIGDGANSFGITKSGTGILVLSTANSYDGSTTINGGTLSVSADNNLGTAPGAATAGNLTLGGGTLSTTTGFTLNSNRGISFTTSTTSFLNVAASQTLSYGGVMAGSGTLVKSGTGELALSGSSSSYSGGIFIDAGTLNFSGGSLGTGTALGIGDEAGSATAATFNMSGNSLSTGRNVDIRGGASSGTRTLNFANTTGTTNTISGTISHTNKAFTINVANAGATALLSGVIGNTGSGPTISITGNGTAAVSNTGNTTDARWNIGSGATLAIGASRNLGADSGGLYADKITLAGGTLRATNGFLLSNYGIQVTSASTISVDNGFAMTNPAVMGGTADIAKSGAGSLVLSGANTNSGKWTVSQGVLSISSAGNLGNATGGDAVTIAGGTLQATAGMTLGSRGITLGTGGGTINVATGGLTNTSGLNGSTALTKTGSGTLSLATTAGNYAGAITVTNGTLQANTTLRGANISVGNASTLNGSVLMGSGQVGTVTINTNGRISPGNSVGILSVSNALTFNGGGSYLWEITNTTANTPGVGWDLISVDTTAYTNGLGTLTIGGSGQFTVDGLAIDGFSFVGSQNYTNDYFLIVRAANISGSLANLAFSGTGLGTGAWTFSSNSTGLFLNYTAPGTTWVFNNSSAADQGTASTTTNGNSLNQLATITNEGAGVTAVIISNSAPMTFTNGNNSYSGTTIIEQGTLVAGVNAPNAANGAFGNAATAIQVGSTNTGNTNAATLLIGDSGVDVGRAITVNSGGAGARTIGATNASGTATYSGNIAANTNVTLSASNSGGTTLFSGVLSGAGAVTASGSGTVVLSGVNTYTNATTVSSNSTLVAANNAALGTTAGNTTVASGGTLALSNNISTAENITIAGTNVGALRNLAGANTNSGTITLLADGSISVDAGSSLSLANISLTNANNRSVTLTGAGNSTLTGSVSTFSGSLTNNIIKDGSGTLTVNNSGTSGTGQLNIIGGTVTIANGSISTSTSTGTRAIDLGISTVTATTSNVALYANSGVTVSNSIYVAPNNNSSTRTIGTESTSGTATFNNEIYLGGDVIVSAAGGGTAAFTGNIVNFGNLTKSGNGIVTLSGSNSFGGAVAVSAGTLNLSGGNAINDTNAVTLSTGATLQLSSTETIGSLAGNGGTLALGANNIALGGNNTATSYAGVITGSGSFTKNGTGSQTLSGNSSSYTGGVSLNNGTLLAGNNGAFGTGTVTIEFSGGSGTRTLAAADGSSYTLNNNFNQFFDAFSIGSAGTGSLTLGGSGKTYFLGNDVTRTRTNTVLGTQTIASAITGSNNFAKEGAGTLVFAGGDANTFVGNVSVNTGVLVLQKTAGVNALSGAPVINSGATLRLGASDQFAGDSTFLTINSGGTFDLNGFNDSLALQGAGNITLGSGRLTINPGGIDTFSGVISGEGSIVKTNSGTQVFAGNNTYTGGTLVAQGTLRIGDGGTTGSVAGDITNNATVTFNRSDNITYSNVMSGTGSLQKWGAGTLTLSGANTVSGANHFLTDGTTLFTATQGEGFGGALNLGDTTGSAAAALAVSNGISLSNAVVVRSGSSGAKSIQSLSTSGTDTISGGVTLNTNVTITAAAGGNLALSGALSGSGFVLKNGAGALALSGSSSNYTAAIYVDQGTLDLAGGSLGSGIIDIGGGVNGSAINASNAALRVSTNGTFGRNITLNGETNSSGAAGTRTIDFANSGGTATLSGTLAAEKAFTVNVINTDAGGILGGAITSSSTLTKSGNGTLTLSGANTSFTGNVDITAGRLNVSSTSGAISDSAAVTVSNGATFGVSALEEIGSLAGGGDVSLGALLIAGGNNASTTYSGAMRNAGGFVKKGTGTMTLSGSSTATGETFLVGGKLLFATNQGGTFTNTINIGETSGTASAVLSLTNGITLANPVTVRSGSSNNTLAIESLSTAGTNTISGALTLNRGATIDSAAGGTLLLGGQISGSGLLTKTNAGAVALTASNDFTGGVQLNAGTLLVGNSGALGSGTLQVQFEQPGAKTLASIDSSSVTLGNNVNIYNDVTIGQTSGGTGSLTFSGTVALGDPVGAVSNRVVTVNGSHTMSGVISGGNGLNKAGPGTLTLSGAGANTYAGRTTISGGVLELNKTAGLNAISGPITVNTGATLLLSSSDNVASTSAVTLSGGTITRSSGVSEVFGNLNLTAASFLDFGTGATGTMSFGTYTPSALLTVNNFLPGNVLTFGSDLTSSINGALFSFQGDFTSSWNSGNSTFTITAIPEPSTYVAAAGLLALFLWPARRRLLKDAKSILGLRAPARERFGA